MLSRILPSKKKMRTTRDNAHQNFNNDMHADFYVMTDPVPIIAFNRDPPETQRRECGY